MWGIIVVKKTLVNSFIFANGVDYFSKVAKNKNSCALLNLNRKYRAKIIKI